MTKDIKMGIKMSTKAASQLSRHELLSLMHLLCTTDTHKNAFGKLQTESLSLCQPPIALAMTADWLLSENK